MKLPEMIDLNKFPLRSDRNSDKNPMVALDPPNR